MHLFPHVMRFAGFAIVATTAATLVAQDLPNIVVIYSDDLGYGDLSCYNPNAAYKTPRLDKMAKEGIRFTDAHSPSTICSPSRYGLYSGQLVCRTGRGSRAFEGPGGPSYIKPGELTIADMVKKRGYRTGVFGKWHVGLTWLDKDGKTLGGGFKNSLLIDYDKSTPLVDGPNERGFDESFVTPNCPTTDPLYVYIENGMVPFPASQRHKRNTLPNPGGKWRWDNDEGWMSPDYRFVDADLLFYDKTVQFITEHRKNSPDQPFFVVFSTQISHAPVLPAPEFNGRTDAGPRGDFVYELDALAGRLLDEISSLGIDDNTLVLFNSDNGPETVHTDWMRQDHNHDAAGGLRGMKRDGWEGGHRVPMIARWPGRIPAGQVSKQLTNTTDIFATVASVVNYELPDDVAVDSYDMLPAMLGVQDDDEPIRPHMLTQSFRGEFQIRQGDWKYLDHKGSGGNNYTRGNLQKYALPESEPSADGQLYNLAEDPGETTNLYFKEETKRQELQDLLRKLNRHWERPQRAKKPETTRDGTRFRRPAQSRRTRVYLDDADSWELRDHWCRSPWQNPKKKAKKNGRGNAPSFRFAPPLLRFHFLPHQQRFVAVEVPVYWGRRASSDPVNGALESQPTRRYRAIEYPWGCRRNKRSSSTMWQIPFHHCHEVATSFSQAKSERGMRSVATLPSSQACLFDVELP